MVLNCYNKGCGQKFDPSKNKDDSCVFHPGVPIFHDALKGWSCCKKRTTDFSEFLSIKGCTHGRHSNVKPVEPLQPEVSTDKNQNRLHNGQEILYQGPKSAERLQKERPSSDEARTKLPNKVSASLAQILEKLDLNKKQEQEQQEAEGVMPGTRCKNPGCKTPYQSPDTDKEVCTYHPGGPVFHEGYKFWSCCCIKTMDFNAFLDQKGCSQGKHCWVRKQEKKKAACRHDWHQTGNNVVVTIYAKNAHPEFTTIEANSTVLFCQIQFENDKIFKREFHFWGVVDVKNSCVNMVPSKVEITLRKADQVSWGKLEDPNYTPEPEEEEEEEMKQMMEQQPDWDIEDDDISDSDEEWAYDTKKPPKPEPETPIKKDQYDDMREKLEEMQKIQMAQVHEDMKKAMERRKRQEEDREKRREEETEEGYEDMPDLE